MIFRIFADAGAGLSGSNWGRQTPFEVRLWNGRTCGCSNLGTLSHGAGWVSVMVDTAGRDEKSSCQYPVPSIPQAPRGGGIPGLENRET